MYDAQEEAMPARHPLQLRGGRPAAARSALIRPCWPDPTVIGGFGLATGGRAGALATVTAGAAAGGGAATGTTGSTGSGGGSQRRMQPWSGRSFAGLPLSCGGADWAARCNGRVGAGAREATWLTVASVPTKTSAKAMSAFTGEVISPIRPNWRGNPGNRL